MNPPKKIAALHDLSCLGRCALTVIIPTLSVMGYQVVPVPTALLSTHTGGYTDLHFHDLTDDMKQIADHFERLNTNFDSIYTGFLGSTRQIRTVEQFIERFGSEQNGGKPLVLIDPVMGEDGELYSTYTAELAEGIRHLCQFADVITPNLTEACFLTGFPYRNTKEMSETNARAYANELMDRLKKQYPCKIAITGIRLHDGGVANLCADGGNERFFSQQPECGHSYPGTGDIFASVLLGRLLDGAPFPKAVDTAADFVAHLIRSTVPLPTATREGVALEPELWRLVPKKFD
jgi:pyridoxine kinase